MGDAIAESYFPHLEDLLDGEQSSDACRLSERVEHRGVLARPTLARLGNASDICGTSAGILAGGCVAALVSTLPANASVIYFSWGLDDVCASCFGHRPSLDDYKNNLEAIYATLRTVLAPNGSMIFATTTPAPPSDARRSNDDVVALNAAARELFGPGGAHPEVLVDDLYAATGAGVDRRAPPRRGAAAVAARTFRGGESRRCRGCDVDIPWRRVAASPRSRRRHSVDSSRDAAAAATCSWGRVAETSV